MYKQTWGNKRLKPNTREYVRAHERMYKLYGGDSKCEKCGTTQAKQFDWSNISGQYLEDRSDWERLCKSCHVRKDKFATHCPKGHEFTPENTYLKHGTDRNCRECKRIYMRVYNKRKALNV